MTPVLAAYLGATALGAGALLRRAGRETPADRIGEREGRATIEAVPGVIWVSAASLGELRSVLPLIAGRDDVLVTTQTRTAADATRNAGLRHQFTPLDTPDATTRFLDTWSPRATVFVESEVPARMVRRLAEAGTPMALIGARPSRTRARAPKTMAGLLSHMGVITAASPTVATELKGLGLTVAAVEDLKAASVAPSPDAADLAAWQAALAGRKVWMAASTHEGEEEIALAAHGAQGTHGAHGAHGAQGAQGDDALLLLAPRHPERFAAVAALCPHATRSSKRERPQPETRVHLVDQMGALPLFYALSHTVFLGGSLVGRGGHNPYEPAQFGCHILTGPHIRNHQPGYEALPHHPVNSESMAKTVARLWDMEPPAAFAPREAAATKAALTALLG
ncbi:MAG: glycosyltransferase N-terminal domain-containing protein [Pseudomonadota bacterium]